MDAGLWHDRRAGNLLDGGVPWYDTYETSDGKHVAIGSLEPRLYETMLDLLGLTDAALRDRSEANWPNLRAAFAEAFRKRTRDEWCALLEGTDVCCAAGALSVAINVMRQRRSSIHPVFELAMTQQTDQGQQST